MSEKYQFSVIIPHYQSFDLLRKCLRSIPNNGLIQVIVVDDKSPDKEKYWNNLISDFSYVTFVSLSENKGAGFARNIGLKLAKGKWTLFIDADDYFVPKAFDVFMDYYNSISDIIYFKSKSIDLISGKISDRHLPMNRDVDQYDPKLKKTEDILKYRRYSPLCKMIRTEMLILNHIEFDEVKYSNDIMFSAKIGYYAQAIDVSNQVVCCITCSSRSLTRKMSKEAILCRYKVAMNYNEFLVKIGKSEYRTIILKYFIIAFKYNKSCVLPMLREGLVLRVNFFAGLQRWPEFLFQKRGCFSHF